MTAQSHSAHRHVNWERFCAARQEYVRLLAETVEQNFRRRDTDHPVFCGCIDWHSSVHGAYALSVAARLTGQNRWVGIVDAALKPAGLEAELLALRRGDLHHELPYGYAWFLALAQEREQASGQQDLLPLAKEIVSQLAEWILTLSDEAIIHHVQRREYGNLSWAVVNVWRWASWKQDAALMASLTEFVRVRLLPLDGECPFALDQCTDEFFPPALHRCRVLLSILPGAVSTAWLASQSSELGNLFPLHSFPSNHSAGLNFSRSWDLWTLFRHTQDEQFGERYLDHVVTHLDMPHYWRDDYRRHAHWVPQFGIYAIALSFEDDAR